MKYAAVIALFTVTNARWSRYRMTDEERQAYYEAKWLANWDTDENGTVEEAEVEAKYMPRCETYLTHMNEHQAVDLTEEEITAECETMWDAWWLAADTSDGAGGDPDGLLQYEEHEALDGSSVSSLFSELSHDSSDHDDMIEADAQLVLLDIDEDGEVTKLEVETIYALACDTYYTDVNAYYDTAPLDQDGIDAACVAAWDIMWAAVDTTGDDVLDRAELIAWGSDDLFEEWEESVASDSSGSDSASIWSQDSSDEGDAPSALDYLMHFDIDETAGVVEAEMEAPYMVKCEADLTRSNYYANIEATEEEVTAACAAEWDTWWAAIDTGADGTPDGSLSVEELEAYFLAGNDLDAFH